MMKTEKKMRMRRTRGDPEKNEQTVVRRFPTFARGKSRTKTTGAVAAVERRETQWTALLLQLWRRFGKG